MTDHIEEAAKKEYETVMDGNWNAAQWETRVQFYTSSRRIINAYLESLQKEVKNSHHRH